MYLQSQAVGANVCVHGAAVEPPSLTRIPLICGKAQAWGPCTGAAEPLLGWNSQPSASVPGDFTTKTSCLGCPSWPVTSSSELPAKYRGKPALPEDQHTPGWICHGKNLEGILEDQCQASGWLPATLTLGHFTINTVSC